MRFIGLASYTELNFEWERYLEILALQEAKCGRSVR
jgi:hypothetical protein